MGRKYIRPFYSLIISTQVCILIILHFMHHLCTIYILIVFGIPCYKRSGFRKLQHKSPRWRFYRLLQLLLLVRITVFLHLWAVTLSNPLFSTSLCLCCIIYFEVFLILKYYKLYRITRIYNTYASFECILIAKKKSNLLILWIRHSANL